MRHRAFGGVNQQQATINHGEDALDFTAEIRMARRIDNIEAHRFAILLPQDAGAFGEDGNAPLALDVVGVHGALRHVGAFADGAGLAQHLIDERGLAMIDVGDDGDITERDCALRHSRRGALFFVI